MTEEEQFYYDQLNEENKKNLDLVIEELKPYIHEEYDVFTKLDKTIIENFLRDNDIRLYNAFKDEVVTPFSLSRYIVLYKNEQESKENAKKSIDSWIDKDLDYFFINNFKDEVVFTNSNNNELKVKYNYDSEKDQVSFYLQGHSKNFPISITDLKMILTGKPSFDIPVNSVNINSKQENDVCLTFSGVKIIIQKQ